ncbi:MAG: RND transporter [Desulfobulbaceae bacterium]|uniref:RND transporter n=1 Tax=Candidatus Desulfobia pelagia TaxID=2841692 RepID=A0A8J6NEQ0_9BACT|nr:RND transporter [Candidatus Desulfobia pelagia]
MEKFLSDIPWSLLILGCLTLGLAPFFPPHIVEKIQMLVKGHLVRPLDWFDLFFHGIPWILLLAKAFYHLKNQ